MEVFHKALTTSLNLTDIRSTLIGNPDNFLSIVPVTIDFDAKSSIKVSWFVLYLSQFGRPEAL